MTFDSTFFGYGVGLVLLGWILGLVVNGVFGLFRKIGLLSFFLFFSFFCVVNNSWALTYNVVDGVCPAGNGIKANADLKLKITASNSVSEVCAFTSGVQNISVAKPAMNQFVISNLLVNSSSTGSAVLSYACSNVVLTVDGCLLHEDEYFELGQIISLMLGGLTGFGFVYTAGAKIF